MGAEVVEAEVVGEDSEVEVDEVQVIQLTIQGKISQCIYTSKLYLDTLTCYSSSFCLSNRNKTF